MVIPKLWRRLGYYGVLIAVGAIVVYPLIWLLFSSFKVENNDIFAGLNLMPTNWTMEGYLQGWKGTGQFDYTRFFANSFALTLPTVVLTIVSSVLVGYGFARFDFPFKGPLFAVMIATLMLPGTVLIIPRYILFISFHWIDTYWPFIVPSAFAGSAFFIFLMVQFFRGIPKELDESAKIDGCHSLRILTHILLPNSKPAIFSIGIFQFLWTWNDFFNSMIFINSTSKYTLPLALRMALDTTTAVAWNQVLAMSLLAIAPCVLLFFLAQKYFVEGMATTGLKG